MKVGPLLGMNIAVALIVAPMVAQQPPLVVVWNASPSVPGGLYLVTEASPRVGRVSADIGLRPLVVVRTDRGDLPFRYVRRDRRHAVQPEIGRGEML